MQVPLLPSMRRRAQVLAGGIRSMSESAVRATDDPGIVWFNRFQSIFAVIAVLSLMFALTDTSESISQRMITVPILGLIVWLYMGFIFGRDVRNARDASIYFAAAVPLLFVLILLHPAYNLLLFAAYWQLFSLLSTRKALVGAAVVTIMMLSLDSGEGLRLPLLSSTDWIVFGFSMIMGGMMAAFIHSLFVQSERRRQLIEELNATRAQLLVQERTAGMLQERHRIAGDFHDTVAQDLASVVMQLEAADAKLPPGMESVQAHVRLARDTARSGLIEARRIVHALVPDVLTAHSITDALRVTSAKWSESTRTPCSFEIVGDPPAVDRSSDVVLLRSLQEALTNVRKHAKASSVVVTLTNLVDEVVLDVHDNGHGFTTDPLPEPSRSPAREAGASGIGLVAMKERVQSIGGKVSLESDPESGTTVSVALPVASVDQPGTDQPMSATVTVMEGARV